MLNLSGRVTKALSNDHGTARSDPNELNPLEWPCVPVLIFQRKVFVNEHIFLTFIFQ